MKRKNKLLLFSCIVFFVASGLIYGSRYPFQNLDLKSLPTIRADQTHQFNIDSQKKLIYEVPPGKGFVLDTSEYKEKYAEAPKNDLLSGVERRIMLDPVGSSTIYYFTVDLVPGRHLYAVCPDRGLRSGEKYTLRLADDVTDSGHWNLHPFFEGEIHVQ
jgi:hypothetical protein